MNTGAKWKATDRSSEEKRDLVVRPMGLKLVDPLDDKVPPPSPTHMWMKKCFSMVAIFNIFRLVEERSKNEGMPEYYV